MQYKKLTKEQRVIRGQRMRYAARIGRIMADNPNMTLADARKEMKAQDEKKKRR